MKRAAMLLLILCVLLSCAACGGDDAFSPAFYYLRTDDTIQYGQSDALIAPVIRKESKDVPLEGMLQLYLQGPVEETYHSPIPKGTRLLSVVCQEDTLVLVLSPEFSNLDGMQLTLAGACLAATCHSLTGYDTIQVQSGESTYEFSLNDFVFLDTAAGE